MMRFRIITRLMLLLGLAACGVGWAQATGSLVGTVTDNSGAVISGATVTLTNLGTNVTQKTSTDSNGGYQLVQLLPGMYSLTVQQTGFQQFKVSQVQIEVGVATRADARMSVGAATETVQVSTQAPLLSSQSSSLSYEVESHQVQQLPLNGRNVYGLAGLVPGVVPQGSTSGNPASLNPNAFGNFQIGGGTANQSAEFIDDAPVNASYVNMVALVPTQDSIQEFQIQTNNVSPEYGRFAGGVMLMATKSGTNEFHGDLYEYVRNAALNANLFFNKHSTPIAPRPLYTQNQYGATVGGPVLKNKMFFFLSWEQSDLTQAATLTNTTVPTSAMYKGDFSAVSKQLYDPNVTTCNSSGLSPGSSPVGTHRCAYTAANGYGGTDPGQTPGAPNQIPASELNQAATNLGHLFWPAPTNSNNPSTGQTNFLGALPIVTDYNQWMARGDQNLGSKNRLFERFTDWHKNPGFKKGINSKVSTHGFFGTDSAVVGDTVTISPTFLADFRASFLRFFYRLEPGSCCDFNYVTSIGPGWSSLQNAATFGEYPAPNVNGMYNIALAITVETDNAYTLSGNFTKMLGRHTITFGGEMRKIEWDYIQTNYPGGSFSFNGGQGYTSSTPSDSSTGYGFAAWMLGYPSSITAQEPALSKAVMWYSGLYVNDSLRWTPKLTINAGLRWEQPGAYTETHGRATTMLLNLPQTAVTAAMNAGGYSGTYSGGLGLINSPAYPHNDWQDLHWKLFSPRVGFAYSPTNMWVVRSGFGIAYLPNTVGLSKGPYSAPVNLATTSNSSVGLVPSISMTNPFPTGVLTPPTGNTALQSYVNSLLGASITSPLPNERYAYAMQWNFGLQRQIGSSASVSVGYAGARGNHLPLGTGSLNLDALPDQYDICGSDNTQPQCKGHFLTDKVSNPLSAANGGPIATTAFMGASQIAYGQLLRPMPQYQSMGAISPTIGYSFYQALQVKGEKRFRSAGILTLSYTRSNLVGTADDLTGYLEANTGQIGGYNGVQDPNVIKGNATNPGEDSIADFQLPNRLVANWVYTLPLGRGQRFLSNTKGVVDKLASGWAINGISTFQDGFPLPFVDASSNALDTTFVGGATRPNFVAGCNPKISGAAGTRLTKWFNTACYAVPGAYQFGNEPRNDPAVREQGLDTTDFSVAKDIPIGEHYKLDFRGEFFNVFNWTQFAPPNASPDSPSFGTVTSQLNQPRLIQFSGRFTF